MGISVVSSAKFSNGVNAASALQPAADAGAGGDFSALLGLQLTNPQVLDMQLRGMTSLQADKTGSAGDNATTQDPASLLAAAGLLPSLLAGTSQAPALQPRSGDGHTADDAGKSVVADVRAGGSDPLDPKAKTDGLADGADKAILDLASKSSRPALADAANIAADAQLGANNASNFAAMLAAHTAAAHAGQAQNETAAAAPQISVPLQDSRWAQDFSDKVVWLAKNDQQTAQININPPQLGPMHITLDLSGDRASALFVSPHAEVRQAIEDAMPQLREMLAGAGIDLGQANVGAQLPQQNSGTPQQFSDSRRFSDDNAILHGDSGHGTTTLPQPARSGRGMVDLFA